MINWESIISAFNKDGTLLKWLKTVNKALNEATLTGVTAQNTSETTATITFTFADGTSQTTPPITLPRGAQGIQGIPGENGTDGADALFYQTLISVTGTAPASQYVLPAGSFNRLPVAGDFFMAVFAKSGTPAQSWLGLCNVTQVSADNATCKPSVYVETTGATGADGKDGTNGTNGKDGKDGKDGTNGLNTLTCSEVQSTDTAVSDGVTVFMIPTTAFNRAPVAGDTCTIIAQGTDTQAGKVWICQCNYEETVIRLCNYEETVSSEYLFEVVSSAEVQSGGGSGGGTQLYRHQITNVTSNVGDVIYIESSDSAPYTNIGILFNAICTYGGQYQSARGDLIGSIIASQNNGNYYFAIYSGTEFQQISVSDTKTYSDTVTPL